MDVNPPGRSTQFAMSLALALGALVVFLLLPQRTFHGFDTDWYAALLQAGGVQQGQTHIAYLPLCQLALGVVRWFGGGAVQAMWLASAVGSAIGVFCLHRAALRLVDPRTANIVPIAVALTPACFYFATAAEIHGVFAAGSGAAWWAFARWRDDSRLVNALVVGATCGAAAAIHAFGHLLSPLMVLAMAVLSPPPARRFAGSVLAIVAAHLVVAGLLSRLLGHGVAGQGDATLSMLSKWWGTADPHLVPVVFWREVAMPFLPWSVLAFAGLWVARARRWSLVYWLAVALHAPVVCLFLARPGEYFLERGGYLLPTAVPAVLASAALLRRPWFLAAAAVTAALSISVVAPRWPALYRREFVAAVDQLRHERAVAFLVGPTEIEGIRTELEGVVSAEVIRSLESFYGVAASQRSAMPLPVWFDAMLPMLGGPERVWCVTREAQQCLMQSSDPGARSLWLEHVPRTYEVEVLQRPGLDAVLLHRRP